MVFSTCWSMFCSRLPTRRPSPSSDSCRELVICCWLTCSACCSRASVKGWSPLSPSSVPVVSRARFGELCGIAGVSSWRAKATLPPALTDDPAILGGVVVVSRAGSSRSRYRMSRVVFCRLSPLPLSRSGSLSLSLPPLSPLHFLSQNGLSQNGYSLSLSCPPSQRRATWYTSRFVHVILSLSLSSSPRLKGRVKPRGR